MIKTVVKKIFAVMSRLHEASRLKGNMSKNTGNDLASPLRSVALLCKFKMISPLNTYLLTFVSRTVAE